MLADIIEIIELPRTVICVAYICRCSILANSAYIALLLDDYTLALEYSERLLAQDNLSAAHKYVYRQLLY